MNEYESDGVTLHHGDVIECLNQMDEQSINCCVTSPPYCGGKRKGNPKQKIGAGADTGHEIEYTPSRDMDHDVIKPKDLIGIPWRVALALQTDGWYLRSDIIWHKPNPMPESVTDRPTRSHEHIFLLSKSKNYYYDNEAIKEDSKWAGDPRCGYGRLHYRGKRQGEDGTGQENFVSIEQQKNKRDVWSVTTKPFKDAHFATFNPELITPCILAGCPKGGVVLDPFMGSGTTAITAHNHGRKAVGIELNAEYLHEICIPRVESVTRQQRMFA